MLFAVLASRSERLPTEHLGVMSLEAASLRDRACQGAPATRAKRGEYDPKYHCCRFLSPCFGAGGFAATPSSCSHIRVVSTVGTSPLPCASSQDTQIWGEAKPPSRWPGQLSPCQLPARSGYKHSSFFLQPLCLLSAHGDAERDILQAQPEHAAAQRTGTSFGPERAGWSCRNKTGTA